MGDELESQPELGADEMEQAGENMTGLEEVRCFREAVLQLTLCTNGIALRAW